MIRHRVAGPGEHSTLSEAALVPMSDGLYKVATVIPISAETAEEVRQFHEWWQPILEATRNNMVEYLRLEAIGPPHWPDRTSIGPEHGPGRRELHWVERFRDAVRDTRGRPAGPPVWRARRD